MSADILPFRRPAPPIASAIDQLASFETPAVRWLRIASEQLRAERVRSDLDDADGGVWR
jgi:hypothetical protein